jgi:hypothetical protein
MSRWKAAAIHSSISAVIAVAIGALLFGLWYPPPYFHAAGADQLVLLLVGVDLVIGPLLTLIVFRAGKPGLKFDVVTIAVLQAVALLYGMSVILESRPIFLVATLDRFELVSANEITDADLGLGTRPDFRTRSWTGAQLATAELPTSIEERNELATQALKGRDIQNMPRYYRDYAEGAKSLIAHAQPLDALQQKKPQSRTKIAEWLRNSGRAADATAWVPLHARKADLIMLLDKQTAQPLGALAIDPW